MHSVRLYFRQGVTFLRDHPQMWSTALVAVLICVAFVGMSLRFAGIARDAQNQLFNDRAGWLLDGIVLFATDVFTDTDDLRARLLALTAQNQTIEEIRIVVPAGVQPWLTYVTTADSGTVDAGSNNDPLLDLLYRSAWSDPGQAYTASFDTREGRTFTTVRALTGEGVTAVALVALHLRLSEADRAISRDIALSMGLLTVILLAIVFMFLRHARIVDFATLYKKQLEIDQMKDSFLGMASHELKSPLSVIRGYIEFLRDGALDESTRQEYLRRVDVSAEELRALVDDILDVSRIEMGRLRFSPDYVVSGEVLREMQAMFADAANDKGLALTCELAEQSEHPLHIRVDRGRLKQVMVNLTSNALKYTPTGSVVIRERSVDGWVELSVQDTGLGMTAEEQKKLFDKFYRVENEETKQVSGTGLGLWITKYIVEHMGGTISVESIKGEGSRFVVRFPVTDSKS